MKKILALGIAALLILVAFAGCNINDLSSNQFFTIEANFNWGNIDEINVSHFIGGRVTEWTLNDRQQIGDLEEWFNNLFLKSTHFADGESPGDSDGGEVYRFAFDNGFSFSYGIYGGDEVYIITDGWHKVKNPSRPFVNPLFYNNITAADVKAIEVFTGSVPTQADKKIVANQKDIGRIITVLNALTIEREATENDMLAGGIGTRFLFHLTSGENYIVINHCNLLHTTDGLFVVSGESLSTDDFWNSLNYEAVRVTENELPIIINVAKTEFAQIITVFDYIPYKEIPLDYSLESAKSDNLVVYENGNITAGQSVWDAFVEKAENRNPCAARLGFYYTLDDSSRYSPEHYEEIKNDYPVLYIMDLSFDGTTYTLYSIEDGIEYSPQYRYLRRFTEESPPLSAIYTKREVFILVNDNEVTWEQLQRGLLSSQFGDYINHRTVYSKYTYK